MRTAAVDKDPARAENFPIYQCDLTNASEFALFLQYIEAEQDELLHVDESDLWLLKIGRPRGNVVIKK